MHGIGDNKGTADADHSTVGDKRKGRNKARIQQLINEGEFDRVLWCSGKEPSDCMTKRRELSSKLMKMFETGKKSLNQRMKGM